MAHLWHGSKQMHPVERMTAAATAAALCCAKFPCLDSKCCKGHTYLNLCLVDESVIGELKTSPAAHRTRTLWTRDKISGVLSYLCTPSAGGNPSVQHHALEAKTL